MACVMRRTGVLAGFLGVAVSVLAAACDTPRMSGTPSIEFTRVPKAGAGGPLSQVSTIEGRVTGAQPGQRIVLFAKSGAWWIQPFRDQPFTTIRDDSSWGNSTHAGTDYAALLVAADYQPTPVVDVLPSPGGGVFAIAVTPGTPPFWQTAWFRTALVLAGFAAFAALSRYRMHRLTRQLNLRFEERLAERTRIAQELHDTLLQGFVSASMQLHVTADRLPADSPVKPALTQVLDLMGRVIEEGRNAVRGLRSPDSEPQDLGRAFSRIHEEFAVAGHADFRMIVEGKPVPLTPVVRNEVYRVGREALVNAFQHAGARHVELQLQYAPRELRVLVRDDGRGIDPEVVQSGTDGHWGIAGMRERTERIGGSFELRSRSAAGTEVEVTVPGPVAFERGAAAGGGGRLAAAYRKIVRPWGGIAQNGP